MTRPLWPRVRALGSLGLLVGVGLAASPRLVQAQEEVVPELIGQVSRGVEPFSGVTVVLHRVSPTEAGEIETALSDSTGEFRFVLPAVPREEDGVVFFASVEHQGITYFGQPIARAVQLDSLYLVEAYDTLVVQPGGAPIPVGTRYIVASEEAVGWTLTDLFELNHQGVQTFVATDGGVTWRHPLPEGARNAEAGGGDLAPEATQVVDGEVVLTGPISPGLRQFVLRYQVDALDGLEIPVAPGTGVVEFLLREPAPDMEIEGLLPISAIDMQGVVFRRYAGEGPASGSVRLGLAEPELRLPVEWIAVGLSFVLALAGLVAWGRRPAGRTPAVAGSRRPEPDAVDLRNTLLLEVARLDRTLDDETLTPEERTRLETRREELTARLARRG